MRVVQHFADLATDRGTRAAWARTSLDPSITILRYHLERIMNDQRSNIALNIVIVVLAVGGISSFFVDAWLSPLLLVAAGALAVTQRSALAQAPWSEGQSVIAPGRRIALRSTRR